MAPSVKIIQLPNQNSDGNASTHPSKDTKLVAAPNYKTFHRALAKMWYEKNGLQIPPGVTLELASLPAGYAVFACKRQDSEHVDKYLYGLRAGRFRSTIEFYPHFHHLMSSDSVECKCRLCDRKGARSMPSGNRNAGSGTRSAVRQSTTRTSESNVTKRKRAAGSQVRIKSQRTNSPVYSENSVSDGDHIEQRWNPVNKNCLDVLLRDLERFGTLQSPLKTSDSPPGLYPSWAELDQQCLWNSSKPQWYPRRGEVVFFADDMDPINEQIGWDFDNQRFVRVRAGNLIEKAIIWKMGLVVQPPRNNDPNLQRLSNITDSLADLQLDDKKVAIKRLPDPLNPHESTDDYCMTLISHVRHVAEYMQVLNGFDSEDCDHSLRLTRIFNSVAPWGQFEFNGRWPKATVACKGVWIEGELIQIGDAVRIKEPEFDDISEVMVVSKVEMRYRLESRKSHQQDSQRCRDIQSVKIAVRGHLYSLKPSHPGLDQPPIQDLSNLPKAMQGYAWFPVSSEESVVFAENLKGRLYERECYERLYRRNPDIIQSLSNGRSRLDKGKAKAVYSSNPDAEPAEGLNPPSDLGNSFRLYNHRQEQLAVNLSEIFKDSPYSSAPLEKEMATTGSSDELGKE